METKLSICMPTYNFAEYISDAVRSILDQDGSSEVELIVFDGGSTDNTHAVMTRLCDEYPQIRYIRAAERGGIDRDIANTVDYAIGEYCWLFSSDDVMHPNSLRIILNEIASGSDVYICKHLECTINMQPILEWPALGVSSSEVFDLSNSESRRRYFSLAENTEPFFSFMSGIVVKRATWNSIQLPLEFLGTCWAHVARLFGTIPAGLTVKYLAQPLLSRRGENDSFSRSGIVNRYRIAVDGFNKLADVFFGKDSIEAFHIRRVLQNEINLGDLILAKSRCRQNPEVEDEIILNRIVDSLYYDSSLKTFIKKILYRSCPTEPWVIEVLRAIYRAVYGPPLSPETRMLV